MKIKGQMQLPGTDIRGDFRPSSRLAAGVARTGVDPSSFAGVRADPDKIAHLGASVRDQMSGKQGGDPFSDSELQDSYAALRADVNSQFDLLTRPVAEGGMGVNVEFTADDPYDTPWAIRDDIDNNSRMKVMDTNAHPDQAHSIFTGDENNRFRAVHDAFGHVATGRNFSRHGEEAAYQLHSAMVSPEARPALRSETQLQNAYLNYTGGTFPDNRPYVTPAAPNQRRLSAPGTQFELF